MQLGVFEVFDRIGRGAMGEVWRARHIGQDVPVAIKVLTRKRATDPRMTEAFHHEVGAVARLNHPGIIEVYDYGEITPEAAAVSGDRLVAGSPYFAMEWAGGGSLKQLRSRLGWHPFKAVTMALLDALAHAHARGVIHRDIKPANILLSDRRDFRPGLKLSDFGVAHAADDESRTQNLERVAGTPHYMAPEQFRGSWRDFGPWTDLYALGCVSHKLLTGSPPFAGDLSDLARSHFLSEAPPIDRADLPPGLSDWLRRLLAKSPQNRFQCAADAAWTLQRITDTPASIRARVETPLPVPHDLRVGKAVTLAATLGTEISDHSYDFRGLSKPASQPSPIINAPRHQPPFSGTWRAPSSEAKTPNFAAIGLGLFGLRSIPFVGREHERDVVWKCLGDVTQSGAPEAVMVSGDPGAGKSQLAQWISQRAHELGAATVLSVSHSPTDAANSALSRMISRHFRCHGLSRADVDKRVKETGPASYSREERNALAELICPSARRLDSTGQVRFGATAERYAVALRLLDSLVEERPVLLWFDDVQWGQDSVRFVRQALRQERDFARPILFLCTRSRSSPDMRPAVEESIQLLLDEADCHELPLGTFTADEQRTLVKRLLDLDDELAEAVAVRTEGTPLFAVQLVGDWVQRGVLQPAAKGFRLDPNEPGLLPEGIYQVWSTHLEHLLRSFTAGARLALEIAAAVGHDVDDAEWEAICELTHFDQPAQLVGALVKRRLAVRSEQGWTFIHGMLRECLVKQARETDRLRHHHLQAVEVIEAVHGQSSPGVSERIGRHYYAADQFESAMKPLNRGAGEKTETGDFGVAVDLLDLSEEAASHLKLGDEDERVVEAWLGKARIHYLQGTWTEGFHWAEKAEEAARRSGSQRTRCRALGWRAKLTLASRGDIEISRQLLALGLDIATQNGLNAERAELIRSLGNVELDSGHIDLAEHCFTQAEGLFSVLGDEDGAHQADVGLAKVSVGYGHWDEALRRLGNVLAYFEGSGRRWSVADILNEMGEVHRYAGDISKARKCYERAMQIELAIGTDSLEVVELNLALLRLEEGAYTEAKDELHRIALDVQQKGRVHLTPILPLAACAAGEDDWETWRHVIEQVPIVPRSGEAVSPDDPWAARLAGRVAAQAGHYEEASRAYEIALSRYRVLGCESEISDVESALKECQLQIAGPNVNVRQPSGA